MVTSSIFKDYFGRGLDADLPAPGSIAAALDTGAQYFATDTSKLYELNADGTAWLTISGGGGGGGGSGGGNLLGYVQSQTPVTFSAGASGYTAIPGMTVAVTLAAAQDIRFIFAGVQTRDGARSRFYIYMDGTIIWPAADSDNVPKFYSILANTASSAVPEGAIQEFHLDVTIPVVAGSHSFQVYYKDSSAVTASTFYTRSFRVENVGTVTSAGANKPWYWSPPQASSMTLVSADGTMATLVDDADIGLQLTYGAQAANDIFRGATVTLPTTGDFDVSTKIRTDGPLTNYTSAGFVVRHAGNAKLLSFENTNTPASGIARRNMTSFASQATTFTYIDTFNLPHYRVTYTASSDLLKFYTSADGKNWAFKYSETASSFLGARPTDIGFGFTASTLPAGHDPITLSVERFTKSF